MDENSFLFEEYKLLRAEVTAENNNRTSILTFGLASLSFLVGIATNLISSLLSKNQKSIIETVKTVIDPLLSSCLIFGIIIPLICYCIIAYFLLSFKKVAAINRILRCYKEIFEEILKYNNEKLGEDKKQTLYFTKVNESIEKITPKQNIENTENQKVIYIIIIFFIFLLSSIIVSVSLLWTEIATEIGYAKFISIFIIVLWVIALIILVYFFQKQEK